MATAKQNPQPQFTPSQQALAAALERTRTADQRAAQEASEKSAQPPAAAPAAARDPNSRTVSIPASMQHRGNTVFEKPAQESAQLKADRALVKDAAEAQGRVNAAREEAKHDAQNGATKNYNPYPQGQLSGKELEENRAKFARVTTNDPANSEVTAPGRQTLAEAMKFQQDVNKAKDYATVTGAAPEKAEAAKVVAERAPAKHVAAKPAPAKAHTAPEVAAAPAPAPAPAPNAKDFQNNPALAGLASGDKGQAIAQGQEQPATGAAMTAGSERPVAPVVVHDHSGHGAVEGAPQGFKGDANVAAATAVQTPGSVQGKDLGPLAAAGGASVSATDRTVAPVVVRGEEGHSAVEGAPAGFRAAPDVVAATAVPDRPQIVAQDLGPLGSEPARANPVASSEATGVDLAKLSDPSLKSLQQVTLGQDAQAMTASKLATEAHPSEADRTTNTLGKESPTGEPTPRFDQATYARALQFVNQDQQSKGQEQQQPAQAQAQERQQQRQHQHEQEHSAE